MTHDPSRPDNKTLTRLIQRLAAGEREALAELYELTKTPVWAVALSVLKDPHDAQDVLQETYVRLCAAARKYAPTGSALGWILAVARNLALHKRRDEGYETPLDERLLALLPDGGGDVSDERIVLAAALQSLSQQEREIVTLHAVGGMKHREIAHILSLPLGTTLSKYRRALKKLRTLLEENA